MIITASDLNPAPREDGRGLFGDGDLMHAPHSGCRASRTRFRESCRFNLRCEWHSRIGALFLQGYLSMFRPTKPPQQDYTAPLRSELTYTPWRLKEYTAANVRGKLSRSLRIDCHASANGVRFLRHEYAETLANTFHYGLARNEILA